MDFKEIKELIKIFDASSLNALRITQENSKIKLEKGIKTPQIAESQNTQILSPITTQIPQSPSQIEVAPQAPIQTPPTREETINVGDKVKKGQTLAIIEAMKIMNEIEAEFDCVIKEIIPTDAQPVEYNSPLFVVEKI